jgi:hypothetical protein
MKDHTNKAVYLTLSSRYVGEFGNVFFVCVVVSTHQKTNTHTHTAKYVRLDPATEEYKTLQSQILVTERKLLHTLAFEFSVKVCMRERERWCWCFFLLDFLFLVFLCVCSLSLSLVFVNSHLALKYYI